MAKDNTPEGELPELTAEQIQAIALAVGCDQEIDPDHELHRWEGEGGQSPLAIGAGTAKGLTEDDRPILTDLTLEQANACICAVNAMNGFYERFGIVAQRVAEDQVILSLAMPDPIGGGVGHFRWHVQLPAIIPVRAIELRGTVEVDITAFNEPRD